MSDKEHNRPLAFMDFYIHGFTLGSNNLGHEAIYQFSGKCI